MTCIENVDQEIRKYSLFEGGFECLDQAMRQIPDKPYCVGQEQTLTGRENHTTSRGIERGEDFVFDDLLRAVKPLQQGGFTDVGVAYDCGARKRQTLPMFTLRRPTQANQ